MPEQPPFQGDIQNAIFDMLMVLVQQYRQTMPPQQAVAKACDWLVSLADHVRDLSVQIETENAEKQAQNPSMEG